MPGITNAFEESTTYAGNDLQVSIVNTNDHGHGTAQLRRVYFRRQRPRCATRRGSASRRTKSSTSDGKLGVNVKAATSGKEHRGAAAAAAQQRPCSGQEFWARWRRRTPTSGHRLFGGSGARDGFADAAPH
jgi:hypothetical protein